MDRVLRLILSGLLLFLSATADNWQGPTSSETVEYLKPKPGRYRFKVQAVDRDLNYSNIASLEFTLPPLWHQLSWVRGLIAGGGLAFLSAFGLVLWHWSASRIATRRLEQQLREQEARERLALQESEHRFRTIANTAIDGIISTEVNALDYLVKPVYPSRLEKAIKRLLDNEIETLGAAQGQKDKKDTRKLELEYEDRILLRVGNGFRLIKISAIKCITAEDYYSEVLTSDDQKVLVTIPLKAWEERLPDRHFAHSSESTGRGDSAFVGK